MDVPCDRSPDREWSGTIVVFENGKLWACSSRYPYKPSRGGCEHEVVASTLAKAKTLAIKRHR